MDIDSTKEVSKIITVDKPIPVECDIGLLSAFDINPVEDTSEESLRSVARDGTQLLLNAILSCPIRVTNEGVLITLPEPTTRLPRAKHVPTEKAETKWSKFAKLKGIQGKKRDGKLVFDEDKQDWVPKWGYKGQNKDAENAWAVEVDPENFESTEDPRHAIRAERKAKASGSTKKIPTALRTKATKSGLKTKGDKVVKRSRRH